MTKATRRKKPTTWRPRTTPAMIAIVRHRVTARRYPETLATARQSRLLEVPAGKRSYRPGHLSTVRRPASVHDKSPCPLWFEIHPAGATNTTRKVPDLLIRGRRKYWERGPCDPGVAANSVV